MNDTAFTQSHGHQNMQHPRYVAELNLGQIIQIVALMLTLGGMIWWQANFQSRTEIRLEATEAIRAKYVPIVDNVSRTQDVTNNQLVALSKALEELRDANRDLLQETTKVRERLAAIETVLKGKVLP